MQNAECGMQNAELNPPCQLALTSPPLGKGGKWGTAIIK